VSVRVSLRALYARGRALFDHQQQAYECLGFKCSRPRWRSSTGGTGTHAVQRSAYAREVDVKRQTQLPAVAAAPRDQLPLDTAEAEKGLQLELAELAREVA
jgi:hypothetical protein